MPVLFKMLGILFLKEEGEQENRSLNSGVISRKRCHPWRLRQGQPSVLPSVYKSTQVDMARGWVTFLFTIVVMIMRQQLANLSSRVEPDKTMTLMPPWNRWFTIHHQGDKKKRRETVNFHSIIKSLFFFAYLWKRSKKGRLLRKRIYSRHLA